MTHTHILCYSWVCFYMHKHKRHRESRVEGVTHREERQRQTERQVGESNFGYVIVMMFLLIWELT